MNSSLLRLEVQKGSTIKITIVQTHSITHIPFSFEESSLYPEVIGYVGAYVGASVGAIVKETVVIFYAPCWILDPIP